MTPLITTIVFIGLVGIVLAFAVRFVQRKAGGAFATYVRATNEATLAALDAAGWRWDGDRANIDTTDFKPCGTYKGLPLQVALWNADQGATFDIATAAPDAAAELFLAPTKGAVGMIAALAYSEHQQTHVATGNPAFDQTYFISAAPPGFAAALLARHPALLDHALAFKYLTVLLQHGQLLVQTNLQNQPELRNPENLRNALEIARALADGLGPDQI